MQPFCIVNDVLYVNKKNLFSFDNIWIMKKKLINSYSFRRVHETSSICIYFLFSSSFCCLFALHPEMGHQAHWIFMLLKC